MFSALKRAVAVRGIKTSFDSAFDHALALPIATQKKIAESIKQKTLESLSDNPQILEQKLIALNHQAKFMRQTLVGHGLATSQSDPGWLEAALLESFALAGLSGDRDLSNHVTSSIAVWIKKLNV